MIRAFFIFLMDFVVLGAVSCAAFHPQADWPLIMQSALCSLPLAIVWASMVLIFGKYSYCGLLPLLVFSWLNAVLIWVSNHWLDGLMGEGLTVTFLLKSWPEIWKFIGSRSMCAIVLTACAFVMVVQVVILLRLRDDLRIGLKGRLYVVIGALICAMIVPAMTGDDYLMYATNPNRALTCLNYLDAYVDLKEGSEPVDSSHFSEIDDSVTGVFVIGESASRMHWSLYGYKRNTTPLLGAISGELLAFSNLQCTAFHTSLALRDLFVCRVSDGHIVSLPTIVRLAGGDPSMLSAQFKFGLHDGVDELLFRRCGRRTYMTDVVSSRFYDDALIPYVRSEVSASDHAVVFVHLKGSHSDYRECYPEAYAVFPVGDACLRKRSHDEFITESVNAYDNSILFTDCVLARIIADLRESGKKAFLVYVSDHGESPMTRVRDESYASLSTIPFVVWMSQSYRESYPERVIELSKRTGDRMLPPDCMPIFLRLLGIEQVAGGVR